MGRPSSQNQMPNRDSGNNATPRDKAEVLPPGPSQSRLTPATRFFRLQIPAARPAGSSRTVGGGPPTDPHTASQDYTGCRKLNCLQKY